LRVVLDNGLVVVLQEQRAARVVALQLWVKVGSADEAEDEAGLAHLHEHMLFKGTARRAPGAIAREVEACGGEINAWTSYDQTVYHLVLASHFLDEGLDILSDAATGSLFDPTELAREIEVVCEEIRRSDDLPPRRLSRELFALAYARHPYRRPIIGFEPSVRSFTREKILGFYRRHYAARRMVLVAVGDFDEADALGRVKSVFGSLPEGGSAAAERIAEPEQGAPRARVLTAPVQEGYVSAAWHIPGVRSPEVAALDVLAAVLGQGDSSRLVAGVKRDKGLVNDIHSAAYTPRDPGLLLASASLPVARTTEALAEVLRECGRLRREEVPPDELARVKRILETETIYQRETVQGQARKVGFFEAVAGHVDEEERHLSAVAAVTPTALREAAERYLRPENLSIALLSSESDAKTAGLDEAKLVEIALDAGRKSAAAMPTAAPSQPYSRLTTPRPATRAPVPAIRREVLPNGITLVVREDRSVPLVSLCGVWTGGTRSETPEDNGVHRMLARSFMRGTESRPGPVLAREVDELAATLDGTSGRNSIGLRGEFLSADLERGFDLFADVLLHPALDETEVAKERTLQLEEIRSRDDNPGAAAFALFGETLWDRHPYRLEIAGTRDSVEKLDAAALRSLLERRCRMGGLVLSVAGDAPFERVRELALAKLHGVREGSCTATHVDREPPPSAPREAVKRLDRRQAHVVVGFRGSALDSPDRFALEVLSAVLSGQGGRLFLELRDRRSMAYSVTCAASEGLDPGYFAVYLGTAPEKVPEARTAVVHELQRLRAEPPTVEELERSRRYLVGVREIGLQRSGARAAVMAYDEAYGLGAQAHLRYPERILGVRREDVLAAARRYVDFEHVVAALVLPPGGNGESDR